MAADDTVPVGAGLTEPARALLDRHWRVPPGAGAELGYTVPNEDVYPHQWLWDSCFHAVCWVHLGRADRAIAELRAALAHQADDGFVPHLTYWSGPDLHAELWGRRWTSCVTQPPLYGHALAELARHGAAVDAELVERAVAALDFLLRRRSRDGLVAIVHPWESGCDDSPRWDAWYPRRWAPGEGFRLKAEWVHALRTDGPGGSPVGSDRFEVGSVAFSALVAFAWAELATVTGSAEHRQAAENLATRCLASWDADRRTAVDLAVVGPEPGRPPSGAVRTLEALLVALVLPSGHGLADTVFAELADPAAFGAPFGPTQVHRAEPSFQPGTYWRGASWPQLTYLFWVAARRLGRTGDTDRLRAALTAGARRSGFAEYWHPDTGTGLGARPQSWTALAAVAAEA